MTEIRLESKSLRNLIQDWCERENYMYSASSASVLCWASFTLVPLLSLPEQNYICKTFKINNSIASLNSNSFTSLSPSRHLVWGLADDVLDKVIRQEKVLSIMIVISQPAPGDWNTVGSVTQHPSVFLGVYQTKHLLVQELILLSEEKYVPVQ